MVAKEGQLESKTSGRQQGVHIIVSHHAAVYFNGLTSISLADGQVTASVIMMAMVKLKCVLFY